MHVGFIMDGNRRWAKARGIPSSRQHEEGAANVRRVLDLCAAEGVSVASFWGLSTGNILERSNIELASIYRILKAQVAEMADEIAAKGGRFDWAGDASMLPADLVAALDAAKAKASSGKGILCVLALAYGGRHEIVQAVKKLLSEGADPASVTEESFQAALDTGRFPAPDLIVRTGGRARHSGYFLYAGEYSEYHFTDALWPDFGKAELDAALAAFRGAQRNFGK